MKLYPVQIHGGETVRDDRELDVAHDRPLPVRDTLQRPLRDLRISVTDRCNLRCTYCMPREIFDERHIFYRVPNCSPSRKFSVWRASSSGWAFTRSA